MSAHVTTYEIMIKIKCAGTREYVAKLCSRDNGETTKMFHREARTAKQAAQWGNRHGKVISVRKADPTMMYGNIEMLDLSQQPQSIAGTPIAMSEMPWLKKKKHI